MEREEEAVIRLRALQDARADAGGSPDQLDRLRSEVGAAPSRPPARPAALPRSCPVARLAARDSAPPLPAAFRGTYLSQSALPCRPPS